MPSWLPPLNSHGNFRITCTVQRGHRTKRPGVQLTVNVTYCSEDTKMKKIITGFSYVEREIECSKISSILRNKRIIPFQLEHIDYCERVYPQQEGILETEDQLINYVDSVLKVNKTTKYMELFIGKRVFLPSNEFEAWSLWYKEQKEARRLNFNREWCEATWRLRTESELWDEALRARYKSAAVSSIDALEEVVLLESDDKKVESCAVCLETLPRGVGLLRLPCSHDFHKECIVQWLKTSHVCPLCRHILPTE